VHAPDRACFLGIRSEFPGVGSYPARQQKRNIVIALMGRGAPEVGSGSFLASSNHSGCHAKPGIRLVKGSSRKLRKIRVDPG